MCDLNDSFDLCLGFVVFELEKLKKFK